MTAAARDKRDGPFSDWLRNHKDLDSIKRGLYVCDTDFIFHKYKQRDDKGFITRDVKLMLEVEVKANYSKPDPYQKETLFFKHQILKSNKRLLYSTCMRTKVSVWHFGQFILIMDGSRPDTSDEMAWYTFDETGTAHPFRVDEEMLVNILRFDVCPTDPNGKLNLRKHHLKYELYVEDNSGLFPVERRVIHRS